MLCSPSPSPSPSPLSLYPNQKSAVDLARIALHLHGGALLAHPPGAGKSYIALQLAIEAARTGRAILITAPASLGPQWKHLLRDAGIHASFLSHTRLSLDDHTVADTPTPDFIIVDEAHAFRSPATRRYHTLARLARTARVLLISATPINNSLMDLYFQLGLCLRDNAFAHVGVTDLRNAFRHAARTRTLPAPLAAALRQVIIRATDHHRAPSRRTGASAVPDPATGSSPAPPPLRTRLVHYDLDSARHGFTRRTLHTLSLLSLTAFAAASPSARPPAELLRLTLAKRLESGLAAFAASLRATLAFHSAFLRGLEAGRLVRPRDLGNATDRSDQLLLMCLVGDPIPHAFALPRARSDATRDAARLRRLLAETRTLARHDPKRNALLEQLRGPLAHRRTLIFTEFRETALDLWAALRNLPGVGRLDGRGAWLASGRCSRTELIRRFAPVANHAAPPPPHEQVRTLIATDILSEGVNLQDADTVVAYDLPWNPVRLIQRIGRIDRLGSAHASVEAIIFMPDHWLDGFMALLDRVEAKLETMRRALDGPTATATAASRHATFVRHLADGLAPAAALTAADEPDADGDDPLEAVRRHPRLHRETAETDRDRAALRSTSHAVPVARLVAPARRMGRALLVTGSAANPAFLRWDDGAPRPMDRQTAASLLLEALDSPPPPIELSVSIRTRLERAAASLDLIATPAPAPIVARAIRRVLRLADAARYDDEVRPVADRLVDRLAHGLRAAELIAVARWCGLPTDNDPVRLLLDLDSTLREPATDRAPGPALLAVFLPTTGRTGPPPAHPPA